MYEENISLLTGKFDLEVKDSLSPLFSLADVYVMYTGKNPNGSHISREAVERNISSLKNIPIVGEYIREDDNFKSHGGELAIEEGEIRFINTTAPIGVVPESATFRWDMVADEYGEDREYLVVENAFIWNRDEKMVKALKSDSFGQSMEISITEAREMSDGFLSIDNFYFTALCVLGIDRDGAGYVEPAFSNANIKTYDKESKNEEFAVSLNDMFKDFKLALNDMENLVEEDKELKLEDLLGKYSITLEELAVKIENYEDLEVEAIDVILSESDEGKGTEADETDEADEKDELDESNETDEADETDEENADESDEDDEADEKSESETETDEDDETDEKTSEYEMQIALLEKENADLKSQVESLETRVTGYEKDNHERACNKKIDEFRLGYQIADEVIEGIDVHKFESVDSLETKLFEIVGRMAKKEEFSKKNLESTRIKNNLDISDKSRKNYSFENLFERKTK